jgi:acetyltransferase
VRALRAGETGRLKAFFGGLSPAARRWRFHGAVNELPPAWIERMAHPDPCCEAVLLAETGEGAEARTVGEARYVAQGAAPGTRELAIVVADGWQGHGIGAALLCALEQAACRQGVLRLFGDVQRDNLAMLALATRAGYATGRHPNDPTLVRIAKPLVAASAANATHTTTATAAAAAPTAYVGRGCN